MKRKAIAVLVDQELPHEGGPKEPAFDDLVAARRADEVRRVAGVAHQLLTMVPLHLHFGRDELERILAAPL
jgi:hypothetical protein